MAKFGWGYKATNFTRTDKGITFTLTMSKLRGWYEILKILLFKMQINIKIFPNRGGG